MLVIMKNGCSKDEASKVVEAIESMGYKAHPIYGDRQVVIGVTSNTGTVGEGKLGQMQGVEKVVRVSQPFKLVGRDFHPEDTRFNVGNVEIGSDTFTVMAGPCSVESEEQTVRIAKAVKAAGADMLRGGAYKPRTSPYSFQGLGVEGLKILATAREETGLPVITEVMDVRTLDDVCEYADMLQIGTRNMQNYDLLKAIGRTGMPVMLKRGFAATIDEWLLAAEYIMDAGSSKVLLCERGLRGFDKYTRNTLDLNAVPVVQKLSHLPVLVDPSHGTGYTYLVSPLARAALAVGANAMMVEVHDKPEEALSDGQQALLPHQFEELMQQLKAMAPIMGKRLQGVDAAKEEAA